MNVSASPSHLVEPDLSACGREPIHVPGRIQPHGVLIAFEGAGPTITRASANVESLLGRPTESLLGGGLDAVFDDDQVDLLRERLADRSLEGNPLQILTTTFPDGPRPDEPHHVVAHRHGGTLILELERATTPGDPNFRNLYQMVRSFLARMEGLSTVAALTRVAAEEVRSLTGFDRTLVYRFDEDLAGTVVAEDRNERLPSYLGLRFPASDIPSQARRLYLLNRVRLIVRDDYEPIPIVPQADPRTGRPLDLTFAILRSVSPVHLEYMRNMGTPASLSISIIREGKLWGLISCHHSEPRFVPLEVRTACDLVGQGLAFQLGAKEHLAEYERRLWLRSAHTTLLAAMTGRANFEASLSEKQEELLAYASASGAALVHEGRCHRFGQTPSEPEIRELCDVLAAQGSEEVFATDGLSTLWPRAREISAIASGLLAISISKLHRSYLLWFRPEVVKTVTWGGDPRKPAEPESGSMRIHPRKSFEAWKETVRLKSEPWRSSELEAAIELRNAIVGIVLRRAEEMAALAAELERTNKELEGFSYSVSHDLRAPFRHILGYAELLRETGLEGVSEEGRRYLDMILESAQHAGSLVDHLLMFSRMGRTALNFGSIDMNRLFAEVWEELEGERGGREIAWRFDPLPRAWADLMMVRLVVRNLLSNAIKYTRRAAEPTIRVVGEAQGAEAAYHVIDNGVGFDMAYADKLFGVFQRLHRMEDFEGSGIGLANVRRIVSRHGGRTWADGKILGGATFSFSLPMARES